MKGQIRKQSDGKVILDFPSRGVMMANHQVYTPSRSCFVAIGPVIHCK